MASDADRMAEHDRAVARLNLVLFSPLAPSSAIGRVSRLVVDALLEDDHDVVLVRSEDERLLRVEPVPVRVPVLEWTSRRAVRGAAEAADAVVYQVGNNFEFHRGCLEWLPQLPGLVALHDFFLGGLFHSWAQRHRSEADSILRTWYGADVAATYFAFEGQAFVDATADEAPMTEWIAAMSQGVIAHSSWGMARVLAACPGPVRSVPLPYDAPALPPLSSRDAPRDGAAFNVLTIGHINQNKRVESVIRAIGESEELRSASIYRLVGRIEPAMAEALDTLARESGVRLVISGEVAGDVLREAIAESDVLCSLRLPALESASASTIEAMLYGKAVVVIDTAFYRELPDDVVRKVSPHHEIDDLRRALEALRRDPDARSALGRAAQAWAANTFRADRYARSLVEIATEAAVSDPAVTAGRYFADTLVRWGAPVDWPMTHEIADPLRILAG